MAVSLPTSITGKAQTGFTSPTYTAVADVTPGGVVGEQVAVTVAGGTQVGVTTHSIASPFTITVSRPSNYQVLGKPNPVTGLIPQVPKNVTKLIVRKGVLPLAGQPFQTAIAELNLFIPAGSDTADAPNIRAMLSALIGTLDSISSDLGDLCITGIL